MSSPLDVIPSERSESRDLHLDVIPSERSESRDLHLTLSEEQLMRDLLVWLNTRFSPNGPPILADTPLFAAGIINSLGILELIAWTERATGRLIADSEIRTDYFGTAARIASLFSGESYVGR